MTERTAIAPPADHPCAACPWLVDNHGRPHPDGWYTRANRRRLWGGLRQGEMMTCHPTDPDNPPPSNRLDAQAPAGRPTRLCAGAWALIMVEVSLLDAELKRPGGTLVSYRRSRPHPPLTKDGAAAHIMRAFVRMPDQPAMPLSMDFPEPVGVGLATEARP